MAAAVASLPAHGSNAGRSTTYTRSPTTLLPPSPSRAATRVRINPACVARPDDDAKRRHLHRRRRDEECSPPDAKLRRSDHAHAVSPDRTAMIRRRESAMPVHRRYREESPESKRRGRRWRRRSRSSSPCRRTRHGSHRNDKNHEREPEEKEWSRGRSRSGSSRSDQPRARPDPCSAAAPQQQQMPMPIEAAAIVAPRAGSLDGGWVMQDLTKSFEEVEWRRRETHRKREEARREMDKVVQTVFFNEAFISPQDLRERYIVDLYL